ncbi:Zinc transporter ZupT [compost metagenome]
MSSPSSTQSQPESIFAAWAQQAHATPLLSLGLLAALMAVLGLLCASAWNAVYGSHQDNLQLAMLGGFAGFAATALGAIMAVVLRDISTRTQDVMLGFAAGMMLAASSFSLILPGLEAARQITGNGPFAALTVVAGMGLGVLLMLGLDRFTPHEHESTGPCGPQADRINRVWLFVLAITLHNLPEGMAIGVSFANGDMNVGLPLTSAIAIQDIPEGLAAIAYPVSMGLAAGAMIFVVSHEVIPETHRNGHQTMATLGLMGGFAVMMFLDTALG